MSTPEPPIVPHDPYAAIRVPDYRKFFIGHVVSVFGFQMQTAVLGIDLYQRTHDELVLGLVGLVQFLPVLCFALIAGQIADRCNRRYIVMMSAGVIALSSLGLAAISYWEADYRWMFVCIALTGTARAFVQPAKGSLVPLIVPPEVFPNAVTWNTSGFHFAAALGPAAGGFALVQLGQPWAIYLIDAVAALCLVIALTSIRHQREQVVTGSVSWNEFIGGLRFLWNKEVVLSAILLDMFAVLLGGATTLLPVYATEILNVGPVGFGWMRAAPAIGALAMGIALAHLPPIERAGRTLLWSVVGFGVTTIVFGLTDSFAVALAMLLIGGAFDNISVVIRHTLVQRLTPDELRGRVSAINGIFIGASNELGGFESGIVAKYFGAVVSVVSGGIGTLLVVGITSQLAPKLRRFGRL